MRRRLSGVLSAVLLIGLAVAIGAGVGIAMAEDEVLHACVKKSNGQLRLVAGAGKCDQSESYVFWNKQGPQGLPGEDGEPGQPGPPGPAPAC